MEERVIHNRSAFKSTIKIHTLLLRISPLERRRNLNWLMNMNMNLFIIEII